MTELTPPWQDGKDEKKFINTNTLFNKNSGDIDSLFADIKTEATWSLFKIRKTSLVPIASILTTITSITVMVFLYFLGDTWIRLKEDNSFIINYPFLCTYITKGITINTDSSKCETIKMIHARINKEKDGIESQIIDKLYTYIPLKVRENTFVFNNSPEKRLIDKIQSERIFIQDIINQFDKIQKTTTFKWWDIDCSALSITEDGNVNTNCMIFGLGIGNGSSRIEAIKFIERISQPEQSNFMLLNPPSALAVSEYTNNDSGIKSIFSTQTNLMLNLKYINNLKR